MKKTLHPYNNAKFIFHTNGSAFLHGIPITKNTKKIGSLPMAFINLSYPPHETGTLIDSLNFAENIGHMKILRCANPSKNKIEKCYLTPKMPYGQQTKKYKENRFTFLNTDTYSNELWLRKKRITDQNIETPLSKFKQKYKI